MEFQVINRNRNAVIPEGLLHFSTFSLKLDAS